MKLGAEPKKIAILGALLLAVLVIVYFNYFSGDSSSPAPSKPAVQVAATPAPPAAVAPRADASGIPRDDRRRTKQNIAMDEFSFRQGTEPGEDKPDPSSIDPNLRLDLLARLQQVEAPGALRNIFQYGAAPPPPSAKPIELPKGVGKIPVNNTLAPAQPVGPPPAPPKPTAPPITFKYYGYKISKADGRKQAFLLDGEDIIIAGENDAMKAGRYKVVRIGVNSITIEDTQFKSEQTLQLQADAVV